MSRCDCYGTVYHAPYCRSQDEEQEVEPSVHANVCVDCCAIEGVIVPAVADGLCVDHVEQRDERVAREAARVESIDRHGVTEHYRRAVRMGRAS